jgi:glycosyltransferase involved in cell wall biosynthesis
MKQPKSQIVCVGFPKWRGEYLKSTVQLMTELARDHEVLYIDYSYTFTDLLKKRKTAPISRILGLRDRLECIELENGAKLHLLTLPPFLPTRWIDQPEKHKRWATWNAERALPVIQKAMNRLGFSKPVLINAFHPELGIPLKGKLKESCLIYYCYDEISAAPWISKHGTRTEARFIPLVDAVITSSAQLKKTKETRHPNTFLVKNGVDFQLFNKTPKAPSPILEFPDDRPVVGYLGSIDDRLDYELLLHVIGNSPDKRFLFVGREVTPGNKKAVDKLRSRENVLFTGPQPANLLPHYLDLIQVGMIPFAQTRLTRAIYPLKVNEYLARGKAVVATPFTDLSEFHPMVEVAEDRHTFLDRLNSALLSDDTNLQAKRVEMARQNDWAARAAAFQKIIREVETQKSAISSKLPC